ncbi:SpoIIE family protein phosphatase [Desulfogranum mediterraneum]|uniref:SpoIIE family protein phosphatase n=1 Tax=Desulfogranum mediterraneum TaxID=160661 RepID=UPI000408E524|nr:SpoIIE family protein phosphatase [Desulfogranum mediterraneum]
MARPRRSLLLRLALLILFGTGVVLSSVVLFVNLTGSSMVLQLQRQRYEVLAQSVAQQIDRFFFEAERSLDKLTYFTSSTFRSREVVARRLRSLLEDNPAIYATGVALVPGNSIEQPEFKILFAFRSPRGIQVQDRSDPEQDYQSHWFVHASEHKSDLWTMGYRDQDTGNHMVTYAIPVLNLAGGVEAVVICDLLLSRVEEMIAGLDLGSEGWPFLVSSAGKLIVYPHGRDGIQGDDQQTLQELLEDAGNLQQRHTLTSLIKTIVNTSGGVLQFRRLSGEGKAWLYSNHVPSTKWSLGFVIPESQSLEPVELLQQQLSLAAGLGVVLLLIPSFFIARSIIRPLQGLCRATAGLAAGDFNTPLPAVSRQDEIGELVEDFRQMRVRLQKYIAELARTTAEREKIDRELAIAATIQQGMLPRSFSLPERAGLDIYATQHPAREVGGDLYDFQLLDQDHLYVCIGDVSGKGVPASLFMAVGKTLLKFSIQQNPDPAEVLYHVNNELVQGNESAMFITVFCGIFNFRTNVFLFANAGHPPPLKLLAGEAVPLEAEAFPPLGAMEDIEYRNQELALTPGCKLLFYSDGVTEAMDSEFQLYGEERLAAVSARSTEQRAAALVSQVLEDVAAFSLGAEQADDITMLCFSFQPGPLPIRAAGTPSTLQISNQVLELKQVTAWLETLAADYLFSAELSGELNLVLEEWLVNVIKYGYPGSSRSHTIGLKFWLDGRELCFEIRDRGVAFDPTSQPFPDLDAPLEEREPGGVGLHLIREHSDGMCYRREQGENILTLTKKLEGGA